MAEKKKHDEKGKLSRGPLVPPEKWIVHPVFDSADYLDRPAPTYAAPGDGDADADDAPAPGGGTAGGASDGD